MTDKTKAALDALNEIKKTIEHNEFHGRAIPVDRIKELASNAIAALQRPEPSNLLGTAQKGD